MRILAYFTLLILSSNAFATTYTATIEKYQIEGLGDPFNTVHLNMDITASPCSSTNERDRLTVQNKEMHEAVLSAVEGKLRVEFITTGKCNPRGIEVISYLNAFPSEENNNPSTTADWTPVASQEISCDTTCSNGAIADENENVCKAASGDKGTSIRIKTIEMDISAHDRPSYYVYRTYHFCGDKNYYSSSYLAQCYCKN